MVEQFDDAYSSVQESLKQLHLMTNSVMPLNDKKEDNQNKIVTIIESRISSLSHISRRAGSKVKDDLKTSGLESEKIHDTAFVGTLWENHIKSLHKWNEINLSTMVFNTWIMIN